MSESGERPTPATPRSTGSERSTQRPNRISRRGFFAWSGAAALSALNVFGVKKAGEALGSQTQDLTPAPSKPDDNPTVDPERTQTSPLPVDGSGHGPDGEDTLPMIPLDNQSTLAKMPDRDIVGPASPPQDPDSSRLPLKKPDSNGSANA